MSAEDLPNVRPIEWVMAFRKYLGGISGPEDEQLVLDGMPEPPAGLAYRATMLLVWTWASARTGGDIRAAYSTMARILGLDERTIRRSMKSGREQGWLVRTAGGNNRKPATHRLAIPSWFVEDTGVRYDTNQSPVDNQVVGDIGVPSERSSTGHGMKSYRTWDEVVPDMRRVRTGHKCPPTSRPVDQNNNQGNFQHVDNQAVDEFFAELFLFIDDEAKPTLNKTLRRQLQECIQRGHTAVSIRDEWLVDLPKNYGPGIICQQIKRASQHHPKHLATSRVTTNFMREVVEGKEMPA